MITLFTDMTGQYIPGDSIIHALDSRAKLICFLMMIAAVVESDNLICFTAITVFTILITIISNLPARIITSSANRMKTFFSVVFIMNTVFVQSSEPLWQFGIITISEEGLMRGLSVVFRIIIIVVLSNILTQTTPPLETMNGIKSLLYPLRYLRVPVEETAMILSVAIQFIPVLLEEADTIKKAQIARGARFESRKLYQRALSMLPLIVPVFIAAFKRADELALAMESRGYRGAAHRTVRKQPPPGTASLISIAICSLLCIFTIFF